MKTNLSKGWALLLGFGVGVLAAGAITALLAELKYFLEHGRAGRAFEFMQDFGEQFGGTIIKPVNEEMLDQMIELAQLDEGVRTRRLYRRSDQSAMGGEGDSAIYFDDE